MTINGLTTTLIFSALALFTVTHTLASTFSESLPSLATPWNDTVSLPLYDGGATLEAVIITLEGSTRSDITFTAFEPLTIESGNIGASIGAVNFDNGAAVNLSVAPQSSFAPPEMNLIQDQILPEVVNNSQFTVVTLTGAADILPFIGSGNFTLEVVADGIQSVDTVGGNFDLEQRTTAASTVSVEYVAVPEPTSALIGFPTMLLLGLIMLRRSNS